MKSFRGFVSVFMGTCFLGSLLALSTAAQEEGTSTAEPRGTTLGLTELVAKAGASTTTGKKYDSYPPTASPEAADETFSYTIELTPQKEPAATPPSDVVQQRSRAAPLNDNEPRPRSFPAYLNVLKASSKNESEEVPEKEACCALRIMDLKLAAKNGGKRYYSKKNASEVDNSELCCHDIIVDLLGDEPNVFGVTLDAEVAFKASGYKDAVYESSGVWKQLTFTKLEYQTDNGVFDHDTGVFTAPVAGVYHFDLLTDFMMSNGTGSVAIAEYPSLAVKNKRETHVMSVPLSVTLALKKDEKITAAYQTASKLYPSAVVVADKDPQGNAKLQFSGYLVAKVEEI